MSKCNVLEDRGREVRPASSGDNCDPYYWRISNQSSVEVQEAIEDIIRSSPKAQELGQNLPLIVDFSLHFSMNQVISHNFGISYNFLS